MHPNSTRQRIVETANMLFYQHGFDATSFTDIADAVDISRGNFYYYFKAKDEILDAVIEARLADTRVMLAAWEADGATPAARIRSFIHILIANKSKIKRYGCPVGTLTTELAKLNHASRRDARALFTLFRDWLANQFRALGHDADADALAMHLLAQSQGVATVMNAFPDETFIRREVAAMCAWLDSYTDGETCPVCGA